MAQEAWHITYNTPEKSAAGNTSFVIATGSFKDGEAQAVSGHEFHHVEAAETLVINDDEECEHIALSCNALL